MRTWLSLFLLPALAQASCGLKDPLYSLSGPLTTALKEIGLHRSPKILGISSFYQDAEKKFVAPRIPGGSLLSPVTVQGLKKGTVFYDEALELEKILSKFGKNLHLRKITTRSLTPLAVTDLLIRELRTVTAGCDEKLSLFKQRVLESQESIRKKLPPDFRIIFFLGEIRKDALPELVMANDGIVLWLRAEKKILSYPSALAYVPWSAKFLRDLGGKYLRVGLVDSEKKSITKVDASKMTLEYPRALTPGFDQLQGLEFFLLHQ